MAVNANLYPLWQLIKGALAAHRAALTGREFLMMAFDSLSTHVRIGP